MSDREIKQLIESGESSTVQFKRMIKSSKTNDLVAEMVAMSNYQGGTIIIGVDDATGEITGLDFNDIEKYNNYLFNWATNNVNPSIVIYTETVTIDNKKILVVTVPNGVDKPYSDQEMVFWIKSAANKRKVSPDQLRRLYQSAGKIYAERQRIGVSSIKDIDAEKFREFYFQRFGEEIDKESVPRIMNNLHLIEDDKLTLAGALLFGKNNDVTIPEFQISAIWFLGNDVTENAWRDSRNIHGHLSRQYESAFQFVIGSLRNIQDSESFNTPGKLEIPKVVVEELLVNALVHRDYFIKDSIKLFVFDDRIEIKSPGRLPNGLNVEDIKNGFQRRSRNVIISSMLTDLLPYKGVGSGILRALKAWPHIDFENNIQAEYFRAIIHRPKI